MFCVFGQWKSHILIYDFDPKKWCDPEINADSFTPAITLPAESETWTGHTAKVAEALWGPTNKSVITASEDGTIRRWNLETRDGDQFVYVTLRNLSSSVNKILFAQNIFVRSRNRFEASVELS